jgi:response regulator RpfG family c-di-GMP phosphodiesterase
LSKETRLAGKDTPLQGSMVLADVYDVLVSERSYKKVFSYAEAVKIIQGRQGDAV